jgi:hypothetical protein
MLGNARNDPHTKTFVKTNGGRAARACRRFLRRLRIARITPKELMGGKNISIVDLRQPMDIEAFPQTR